MARIYKAKFRVDSTEVQGPGSWVDFQRPTWGMVGEIADSERAGRLLLEMCVLDWNWTDDEDKPIPLPKDKPDIVDELPQPESLWLKNHCGIVEQKEALKNSSTQSSPT